jgi:hypothetical protein
MLFKFLLRIAKIRRDITVPSFYIVKFWQAAFLTQNLARFLSNLTELVVSSWKTLFSSGAAIFSALQLMHYTIIQFMIVTLK